MMEKYVIGLDFGSLSGRAVLVNVADGDTVCDCVAEYSHAVLSENLPDGTPLPEDSALQHPQDYLDVLKTVVRGVLAKASVCAEQVIGIGVDFTSATILPVDENLVPLCFQDRFQSHPKAYATMWKDHTAAPQADAITNLCHQCNFPYLSYHGEKCSSENGLAKILSILQTDEDVYNAAYRILEAADWITMLLCGTDKKGYNMACCKEFWNRSYGGYPTKEFMKLLDPRFENVVEEKFGGDTVSYDACFGYITEAGSELTGLAVCTPVSVPLIDGYAPLAACGVIDSAKMAMTVGTSLCHMVFAPEFSNIPGIFAAVPESFYPNIVTYEGGQSSCGDHLAWFIDHCLPESYHKEAEEKTISVHALLREKLADTAPGTSGLLCLDWFNGNRSVLNDPDLSGLIVGLTIRTKPEEIYRALLEGTVFGTRKILDDMEKNGVRINEIVACGGIAQKDSFMMQMFADVTNRPIHVCASKQAAAMGAAMFATVAAGKDGGGYDSIEEAVSVMAKTLDKVYVPSEKEHRIYDKIYEQYLILHDAFGLENGVMKRLKEIRREEN